MITKERLQIAEKELSEIMAKLMTTKERLQIAEKELSEIIAKWRESAAKVNRLREQNYRENATFLGGLENERKHNADRRANPQNRIRQSS